MSEKKIYQAFGVYSDGTTTSSYCENIDEASKKIYKWNDKKRLAKALINTYNSKLEILDSFPVRLDKHPSGWWYG